MAVVMFGLFTHCLSVVENKDAQISIILTSAG